MRINVSCIPKSNLGPKADNPSKQTLRMPESLPLRLILDDAVQSQQLEASQIQQQIELQEPISFCDRSVANCGKVG